jgi:D-lyxose ketol-isomerase
MCITATMNKLRHRVYKCNDVLFTFFFLLRLIYNIVWSPKLRLFSMVCWTSQVKMPPSGVWQKCLWKKCMHLGICFKTSGRFLQVTVFTNAITSCLRFFYSDWFIILFDHKFCPRGKHPKKYEDIKLLNQLK